MGGNKKTNAILIFYFKWGHNYSRISPQCVRQIMRPRILPQGGQLETLEIDLFASWVFHQPPKYETWNSDPYIRYTVIAMKPEKLLHVSTIFSDAPCVKAWYYGKKVHSDIFKAPCWQSQLLYSNIFYMLVVRPVFIKNSKALSRPIREGLSLSTYRTTFLHLEGFYRNSQLKKNEYSGKIQIGLEEVVWLVL